ncbi:NAD(P)H-hydrate dehydratase [Cohnella pontilimi]|uniref:Bifunctional NAD(P)H-hydrate repair enzyme n=1 Tax=Cohnella pontilimi TaxID=2564100 RepID=A0A4V5LSA0_9BACL|nr:NAD(P)H-hydrate dehydratase [Cohnella pontilimi]TJY42189.1 NAD(P)H-hydrate dehydratase [Cohnella pontilimi]
MHLVTSKEMREIDRHTIENIGIPALVLMENAGRAIAEEVVRWSEGRGAERRCVSRAPRWLVLVGKGNNGGDGIVCARHLVEQGYEVELLYAVPPEQLGGEAAVQRDIAWRMGLSATVYYADGAPPDWSRWDGIVDALLGTGSAGAPREPYASLIRAANASGLPIVAADVPSGLDADTGEPADPCLRATVTVALAFMKRGLLLYPGAEIAGEVVVRSIGIPTAAAEEREVRTFVLDERTLERRLGVQIPLPRQADTHKGTYGHVLVAAGSRHMSGAGLLCAGAALRSGCGLVTWAVPQLLELTLAGRLPEAMLRGLPDGSTGEWRNIPAAELAVLAAGKQAVAIGPGMARWAGDSAWLRELWDAVDAPLVLDADALNMLADANKLADVPPFAAWPRRASTTVLTPHPGEMARLCGMSVRDVQRDRIGLARQFAVQHDVTLVLKGARTVVATPDSDAYVNTTGNPGMATGGAGDVLAGVIAGLLAQGLTAGQAAAAGVFLHGTAGDLAAAKRPSPGSLIAGDIIHEL